MRKAHTEVNQCSTMHSWEVNGLNRPQSLGYYVTVRDGPEKSAELNRQIQADTYRK